jgi:radical SAM superfamily enzyme YgiQ (UPF0313 family)
LDDHLFGNPRFASMLFDGMRGMGRLFQGAATVNSLLKPGLLASAAQAGLRSVFVGFENLSGRNLSLSRKTQNLGSDYAETIRWVHDRGVMINGSFVFGMDEDCPDVFNRTVEWAIDHSIETATFHIPTPYPGTGLFARIESEGRLFHRNWDFYDTRHCVFRPAKIDPDQLEEGYWSAYENFYRWSSMIKASLRKPSVIQALRHLAYASGWKKFEGLWNLVIRTKHVAQALPILETVLSEFGRKANMRVNATASLTTGSLCSGEFAVAAPVKGDANLLS